MDAKKLNEADARAGPPRFDVDVPPGGYAWWYLDAVSDDGRDALVVIAFIGSVFSPYYSWSRAKDPFNHVAINVALYGAHANRWAMTERGRGHLSAAETRFQVARSSLAWDEDGLTVRVDERAAPLPRPLQGEIKVSPGPFGTETFALDDAARHHWRPVAPRARARVRFDAPALHFEGDAYVDMNWGTEPLGAGFRTWDWRRGVNADGETVIVYDAETRAGADKLMGLVFGGDGRFRRFDPPPPVDMPRGLWGVRRRTRGEAAKTTRLLRAFEDAPFYTRSLITTTHEGRPMKAVHESLDMDRFASRWVRALLPFRMPRFAR